MSLELAITGADGQVGLELQRQAAAAGLTYVAWGRQQLDISDGAAVATAMARYQPHVVINAAAYTAVDKAEEEPGRAWAVNRDGPGHLAMACHRQHAALIHISTDYVFNGSKATPYQEEDEVAPLGVYGASKEAGEMVIRQSLRRHVIVRTAWVYGLQGRNFVHTMLGLARERSELKVVADQYGSPTFAGDLAAALLTVAQALLTEQIPPDGLGTFHCAGSGDTSWYGFAEQIFAEAMAYGFHVPRVTAIPTSAFPTAAPRPANSVLDCSRIKRIYGIELRPWQSALAAMLAEVFATD